MKTNVTLYRTGLNKLEDLVMAWKNGKFCGTLNSSADYSTDKYSYLNFISVKIH